MSVNFKAGVLYQNEEFIGNCTTLQSFNCALMIGTPRVAWLVQSDGEEQYEVTFYNPLDNNALQGVWISIGPLGTLLNVASVDTVINACNACCGSTPVLALAYTSIPAYVPGQLATYTMTRQEDGSAVAFEDFSLDYMKYIYPGTLLRTAYNSSTGIATYTFQSYKDPIPLGPDVLHSQIADVLTGETPRVFNSNTVATSPGGGNSYYMAVQADGVIEPVLENATLAGLVTAANASGVLGPLGTWSTAGGIMTLTSTSVYGAIITVTIAAT
jgi:hypothetical protein